MVKFVLLMFNDSLFAYYYYYLHSILLSSDVAFFKVVSEQ